MSSQVTPTAGPGAALPVTAAFGARLRSMRHRHGWSQQQLGAVIFFSREYVALVERGLRAPTATFVERAEAALGADGALRAAFVHVEENRERAARRRAEGRSAIPRRGKIVTAARQLPAVTCDASTGEQWAAFDDLHRVLRAEIEPVEAGADVAALEQRYAACANDSDDTIGWAVVASAAARGLADAGALLQRPLHHDHAQRLVTVARKFAVRAADALLMLGEPERASAWYGLAETVQHRCAPMPGTQSPLSASNGASVEHVADNPVPLRSALSAAPLAAIRTILRCSAGLERPARRAQAEPRPRRRPQAGRCGRGPPAQVWSVPSES